VSVKVSLDVNGPQEQRKRECVCVSMRVCVCVRVTESVCVCERETRTCEGRAQPRRQRGLQEERASGAPASAPLHAPTLRVAYDSFRCAA